MKQSSGHFFKKHHVGTYVVLILLMALTSLPMISMIGNALKANKQVIFDRGLFPKSPTLSNFVFVFQETSFPRNLLNSLIASVSVTIVCVWIACMAGYALSRYRGTGFTAFKSVTYMFQVVPLVLLMIPLFMIVKTIGLHNNILSIIISYAAITLPLAIWTMKGFFDTISFEIEESALIDGAGIFRSFLSIILPISTPGIMTAAVLTFTFAWNEYMLANIFIQRTEKTTLTVALAQFAQQSIVDYGYQMAAASIASIPAALLLVFAQKYIIQGLSAGATKG